MIDGDDFLLREMGRVTRGLTALFHAKMGIIGLTASRARVLLFLHGRSNPVGQSEIASFLQVEPPTAVKIIDGLEVLGYVARLPDPSDRRAKLILLTPDGIPMAKAALEVTEQLAPALLAGISGQDLRVAERVLGIISKNFAELSSKTSTAPQFREAAA
ncbi:MAG: MarR family transcriptional regulator [Cypionkella sp.]|uniref:MarR family winged helix-turn-helix transcriptional regulator n=1 Tax=Cypionkella sp. TaxID=2811411 RepID=UPI00262DD824|nr:MarR family transcriptional regulator [Cypionkella sp.]MDB5659440.1 MarR family transcriptional regulator [Cypionkella sp.]